MKIKLSLYHSQAKSMSIRYGLTIVEAVVSTAITTVLLIIVFSFIIEGTRVEDFISDQSAAVASAEDAISRMTSIVREVTDGDDGAYSIVEATPTSFAFYTDLDTDEEAELVRYYLDETNLIESITEPTGDPVEYNTMNAELTILSRYIVNQSEYDNEIFRYYNSDYPADTTNNPLSEPIDVTEITLIETSFDVNVNPTRIPDTDTVSTFIQLRNLKSNL